MSVVRVNWTMMAMRGDNWELLKDYESEGDGEDSPMSLLTSDEEQGDDERPSKGDFKVALKTVLKALDYGEEIEQRGRPSPHGSCREEGTLSGSQG